VLVHVHFQRSVLLLGHLDALLKVARLDLPRLLYLRMMKLCHLIDSAVQVRARLIVDVLPLYTLCVEPNLRKRGL